MNNKLLSKLSKLISALFLSFSMGFQTMSAYAENLNVPAAEESASASPETKEELCYETNEQCQQSAALDENGSDREEDAENPEEVEVTGSNLPENTEAPVESNEEELEQESGGGYATGNDVTASYQLLKQPNSDNNENQQEQMPVSEDENPEEVAGSNSSENIELFADSNGEDDLEPEDNDVVTSTVRKIVLNLSGGHLADGNSAKWTSDPADGSKLYYVVGTENTLSLPILDYEGYTFGGWKKDDGSLISYDSSTGSMPCELDLSEITTAELTLTAVWQKYTIEITNAKYSLPFGVDNNTLEFTHYNKNGQIPNMEDDILPFLDNYVKTLMMDYTISYTDDQGIEQEEIYTNISFDIQWDCQYEDFSDVVNYLNEQNYNGEVKNVYLEEDYLKKLILSQSVGIGNMSKDNIVFSDDDRDKTALKIKLGSSYNKNNGISGNPEYMIDTVSPSNVHVNLFDYWQLSPFYYDRHPEPGTDEFYKSKLNNGHALIFSKNGPSSAGWNSFTGSRADVKTGIVKKLLDESGYPELDLKKNFNASGTFANKYEYNPEESLQYLFDPGKVDGSDYGRAYSDVKGLFKINEDGNYYYSSHDNFAEYNYGSNSFNVYNVRGIQTTGTSPDGQFFPFNTADQAFVINNNGQLADSKIFSASGDNTTDHYLGLSMMVDFQQPVDGLVSVGENAKPMTFEFSGDDDVWIFIDNVLVADLGGIHDEASVEIDFSTGNITKYLSADKTKQQNRHVNTLKEMFDNAGVTGAFNGNTFAGNTTHTLKMFYLERGNYDSNLSLSFNLMEPVDSQIIKLDQDGDPVENAEFALYEAKLDVNGQPMLKADKVTYETAESPIASNLNSNDKGQITIPANYDFSQHIYYVLREIAPPDGYFGPGDVLLKYDKYEKHPDGTSTGTNLLLVDNRWTTGAVGNFTATIYQSGNLHYDGDNSPIDPETGKNGLILAVPMMTGADGSERPLYGSNMAGFNTVTDTDLQKAALKAALYQIFGTKYGEESEDNYSYGFQKWYMEWDENMDRYEGVLNDLPGDATQYYWTSGNADANMSVSYYLLNLKNQIGIFGDITKQNGKDKIASIASKIYENAQRSIDHADVTSAVEDIASQVLNDNNGFRLLDVSLFNRTFASRIYVPNTQPDLRVRKLDQDGNAIQGVEFGLFADESCTLAAIASGTTDKDGLLVFSETAPCNSTSGNVRMHFTGGMTYYLKEIDASDGYDQINTVIPVYVTSDGRVYADALEKNDGITVRKGLGKLVQTMAKYAGDGSIDGTLRDITGELFTVENFNEINGFIQENTGDVNGEELNFCYGATNALLEYGTHQINGVYPNPYFEVDEGIAGIIVHQNYDAHQGDELYNTYAQKADLENVNIRGLFTGSTTVVVRNRKTDSLGTFSIKKTVTGTNVSADQQFDFTVKIEKQNGETATVNLSNEYKYTVTTLNNETPLETGTITFTGDEATGWTINTAREDNEKTPSYIINEDGKTYIRLSENQMITVEGIPFGLNVTATETESSSIGYQTSVSVNGGQWVSSTEASGIVERPIGNPSFVFNNHKDKVTDLELKKEVLTGENDKSFTFDIILQNSTGAEFLTGTYHWQMKDKDDNDLPGANNSGILTNGHLIVSLKHGQKVVIQGLPIESKYLIKEDLMGYTPTVLVNGIVKSVVDGAVSGTIEERVDNEDPGKILANEVIYQNARSGSITITKRSGAGSLLSGAGFTLYSVDDQGNETKKGNEQLTRLAVRTEINASENGFDQETMRYSDETNSYIVHRTKDGNNYFYYRFLTDAEIAQYYAGAFSDPDNVEAIVQFVGITDFNVKYKIVETKVPNGYVQSPDINDIVLPKSDGAEDYYDLLYTVTNHKQLILPTSGLKGIALMLGAGIILIGIAFMIWKMSKNGTIQ